LAGGLGLLGLLARCWWPARQPARGRRSGRGVLPGGLHWPPRLFRRVPVGAPVSDAGGGRSMSCVACRTIGATAARRRSRGEPALATPSHRPTRGRQGEHQPGQTRRLPLAGPACITAVTAVTMTIPGAYPGRQEERHHTADMAARSRRLHQHERGLLLVGPRAAQIQLSAPQHDRCQGQRPTVRCRSRPL